ncbi:bifunctional tetrahydrofolate synthase/dihydrofolate synthase [Oxalicibacterium faecigallinarum]|uniref:Dihydrofolate synthase/folylpolyglutamate synthase n=1 Tax=Oxalicibacterium faecigallinarum TaxID=573741 RepID=A0A8J3F096_9BURK|nr:bifunctional tetrahydrofolate synthase/dihydrofolate synthase [Oxalicibacterium faecigallinarum]GGI16102.1 bifunctional folylpolyglutamate synthase/dihydrofolate synthase [Oxalicibacterium faecigallinarum]
MNTLPVTLDAWFTRLEAMHPKTIDMGLSRVQQVKMSMQMAFACPVITVGGTNGKGSTCAMLEAILLRAGYRVGLYTSPHLLVFNERVRINGQMVDDAQLIAAFNAIEQARGDVSLSYFEFTTLAAMWLFAEAGLDAVILEVGLGGRLDAVNVLDADVAIVTSVDIDHTEYLGDTREKIGFEKAGIFRTGRTAICGDPVPPASLVEHAEKIGADLWLFNRDFNYAGDKQQWNFSGRGNRRNALAYPALRGANQLLNASSVLAALEALRLRLPVSAQDVRSGLATVELVGRFQILPGKPLVILDVAHNPHAAATLAQNLDNMGFHPYTHAVFGAMQDKDIEGVLAHLKGRIDHWYLTDLPLPRAASASELRDKILKMDDGLKEGDTEHSVQTFASPAHAFANALSRAGESDRIAVFGSFLTVAGVMEFRNSAQH